MNTDITEQYLEKVYDDLSREQMNLMGEFRNAKEPEQETVDKMVYIQKQLTQLNSLMTGVLKYRNLKKEIKRKTALNCA
jgi:hypothetical protein